MKSMMLLFLFELCAFSNNVQGLKLGGGLPTVQKQSKWSLPGMGWGNGFNYSHALSVIRKENATTANRIVELVQKYQKPSKYGMCSNWNMIAASPWIPWLDGVCWRAIDLTYMITCVLILDPCFEGLGVLPSLLECSPPGKTCFQMGFTNCHKDPIQTAMYYYTNFAGEHLLNVCHKNKANPTKMCSTLQGIYRTFPEKYPFCKNAFSDWMGSMLQKQMKAQMFLKDAGTARIRIGVKKLKANKDHV